MKLKYDKDFNKCYSNVDNFIIDNCAGLPSEGELTRIYNELPEIEMDYDSEADTLKHIKRVAQLLTEASSELIKRANCHDDSKLKSPEKFYFDKYTPKLAGTTYGSDEYKSFLTELQTGLKHHYENNSHHPEHYEDGVDGMNLFDLIEMFFDWKAATERHNDGNIFKSIEINQSRFKISDQLKSILINTAHKLNY